MYVFLCENKWNHNVINVTRIYTMCILFLLQLSCEEFPYALETTAVTADGKCRFNAIPPLLVTPVPRCYQLVLH